MRAKASAIAKDSMRLAKRSCCRRNCIGPRPNAPRENAGRRVVGFCRHDQRIGQVVAKMEQVEEEASMSPQEVQLQKKKAMLDKMIATKRMQGLKNAKSLKHPPKRWVKV